MFGWSGNDRRDQVAVIDVDRIRHRLAAIAELPHQRRVFGAAHHQWTLAPVWSLEQIEQFEATHGGRLPADYRQWLLELGSHGAGPGNGLFVPGGADTGGGSQPWKNRFGRLDTPFPYTDPVAGHRGRLPGAMPVCDLGCGTMCLLVTGGPRAGDIWVDDRANRGGLRPEDNLDFAAWIDLWLHASERQASEPRKPRPARPNRPESTNLATALIDATKLDKWVAEIQRDLAADGRATMGHIGAFVRRGDRTVFEVGSALHRALEQDTPLPGRGTAQLFFSALLEQPPWLALEVPGLFRAWIRENRRGEFRDYLDRPAYFGSDNRSVTVVMLPERSRGD